MKRILVMTLLLLLITASTNLAVEVPTRDVEKPNVPSFLGYAENRIVVKFDPSVIRMMDKANLIHGRTGIPDLDQVGTRHGVASIRPQFPGARRKTYKGRVIDLAGWHKIRFHGKVDALDVVERYKRIPGVIDAQPVGIHTVYKTPNDPDYPSQWHLPKIQAPEAWDFETGNPDIVVAILDTGVRYFHKDLGGANASYSQDFDPANVDGNIWVNEDEVNGDGIDNDSNGFVDDKIGWDFVQSTADPFFICHSDEDCIGADNDPRDFNGHGTHCAGIVAAMNNNSEAVASVAGGWGNGLPESSGNGVKVMPLRIGWTALYFGLIEVGVVAMDYAAEAMYYAADNGARIASCSWGSENTGGIGAAIDYFLASGGLVFKAAGNDGTSTADYMGSRTDVINVAATDRIDCKASFSNYGAWVDISAPGVDINSLFHDYNDPTNDTVTSLNGTSMATPLAASVAALIWSQN
ncbi:MAG: S8 family serine peptidase, partial [Candidatus Thorarchaeota archaeon]